MPRKSRIIIIAQQRRRGRQLMLRMTMTMTMVLLSSLRQGSRTTTTAWRKSLAGMNGLVHALQISPPPSQQFRLYHPQKRYYDFHSHHVVSTLPPSSFFQQRQRQLSFLLNTRRYSSASTDDSTTAAAATNKAPLLLLHHHRHYLQNLNEPQTKAVTQPRTCITRVVAGPGSGKTRVLTCRIAHLLLTSSSSDEYDDDSSNSGGGGGGKNTERVLAVTFTRKAAGEMQQRVEQLLLGDCHNDDDDENDQQQQQQQREPVNDNVEIIQQEDYVDPNKQQQRNNKKNHHLLQRVTLGTFHSVCAKILRWNGQLLSQLPSVQHDLQQQQPQQQSNVGGNSASSSSAAAGGGVLDGSFTIIDQAEQLRIVRECLADLNLSEATKDETKPMAILDAIMKIKAERSHGGGNNEQTQQQQQQSRPPLSRDKQVALQIYARYRQQVLSTNRLDFDDLLLLTRELLVYHDDVQQRCQRFWTHILVDEFQDTSTTQLDLVRLLTTRSLFVVGDADQAIYSWRGAHVGSLTDFFQQARHHFGQEVQTVHLMENYRSTSNIVQAAQKVISSSSTSTRNNKNNGQAAAQTTHLGQVDDGADQLLRKDMKPKRGAGPTPRIVACENAEGEAKFVAKTIRDAMDANKYGNSDDNNNNKKSTVALIYRTNAQSRALEEACVKYNLPYVIFGSTTSFYKRREILDCLCFLRWIYNGRDRSAMLRAMKTPSRGIGDVAQEEFEQYCALVADDAYNGNAESNKPTPLDVLISLSDEQSEVASSMGVPPPTECISSRALKPLMLLSQQMRAIRDLAYQQPVEIVLAYIIDTLGLLSHFDKYSQSKSEFEERKGNVQELQQASKRYTNQGSCLRPSDNGNDKIQSDDDDDDDDMNVEFATSPLGTFLDDISLITETADELQKGNDQRSVVVCLMTIHASKGMEFDQVFLVGNEDGIFPTSQAIKEGEGSVALEEEKRLCYVAMTRAKTELCLTWRREVPIFTSNGMVTRSFDRSRFLDVLASKKKKNQEGQARTDQTMNQRSRSPRSSSLPSSSPKQSQRRDYSSSAWSSTSASDFQGTNSVYAINRPAAATSPSRPPPQTKTSSPQQPWQKKGSGNQKSPLSSNVRQKPSWRNTSSKGPELPIATGAGGPQTSSSSTKKKKKRKGGGSSNSNTTNPTPPPDSTWFFPVGSSVMHKELGRGIVLQPPPSPPPPEETSTTTNSNTPRDDNVDLLVRVKFPDSGEERHFSARGSEITPILI